MSKQFVTILGKTVKHIAKIRGGGSALPGLVVEKIDPNFMKDTLASLPMGIVVISGTNGKTTTTKMVVELLQGQGLKVFTNKTGSNFTRGVVASLLSEVNIKGELGADIAVLELDEAHAVHFVKKINPKYSLLLNVMRDQLDRFGEIDYTASLLDQIAQNTTDAIILNREDKHLVNIGNSLNEKSINYFGLDEKMRELFPNDDELHSGISDTKPSEIKASILLKDIKDKTATFLFDQKEITTKLKLSGVYNIFNVAAALALVKEIVGDAINLDKLISTLENIKPAFGRGEVFTINNRPVELVLVKNPSGFRLGLKSFSKKNHKTMIAINDNYADGRDMSWLWDVNFDSLRSTGVSKVSGARGYDMALRLQYDEVKVGSVQTNLKKALLDFINKQSDEPKTIFCTYTAMLSVRRELKKIIKRGQ